MKCFWPARKRYREQSPGSAPTLPTGGLDLLADVAVDTMAPRPRPRQVPRLNLDGLRADTGKALSPRPGPQSPIPVTIDGVACATARTLGRVIARYQQHQAVKDVASQVEAIRRAQGFVRLVVGGERAPHEYRSPRGLFAADTYAAPAAARAASPTRACELTLNNDATALPHLWGDVAGSPTMMRFEDNSIDAVTFEFVPYTAFTCWGDRTLSDMYENHRRDVREGDAPGLWSAASPTQYRVPRRGADTFAHLARVMRPGGILELTSGFPPNTPRGTMMQALGDAGFVVLHLETPQSPRTMGDWLGTAAQSLTVEHIVQRSQPGMVLRAAFAPSSTKRFA